MLPYSPLDDEAPIMAAIVDDIQLSAKGYLVSPKILDDPPMIEEEQSSKRKRRISSESQNIGMEVEKKSKSTDGKTQYFCQHQGCEKVFTYLHVFKRHQLVHTGEKAFACPNCDMRFARKDKMAEHFRLKHTERKDTEKHVCHHADCQKVFTQKGNLKRHLNTHHFGEKAFACLNCDKRFARKEHLTRHAEKKHSEGNLFDSMDGAGVSQPAPETEFSKQECMLIVEVIPIDRLTAVLINTFGAELY